jgi:acetyl-CoA carboxylase biotin carboxylase subunit
MDSHVYAGYRIPPNYDSLLAKLIVHGPSRADALDRLARALDEYTIEGVKTTIPLHREIVRNAFFRKGDYDTGFLEEYFAT